MIKTYDIAEFAALVNRSVKSVQRWDREKKLKAAGRTFTNRRYYTDEQVEEVRRWKQ